MSRNNVCVVSTMSDGYESCVLQRRNANRENQCNIDDENIWDEKIAYFKDEEDVEYIEPRFTLMEEVFLLGLKDKLGYTSFWNDSISRGLRGCVLVELGLRGKIYLENSGARRKSLASRKIVAKCSSATGDTLLDEALKCIKDCDPPDTVRNWLECFCGDTWNPLKLRYCMKNVKERVAKNLVDKGVLTTDKVNFFIFDLTTHPLSDVESKTDLIKKVQEALLVKWNIDPRRSDPRLLSLLFLARVSEVMEQALELLNNEDYEVACKRISEMENWNIEQIASKVHETAQMHWAVFSIFSESFSFI